MADMISKDAYDGAVNSLLGTIENLGHLAHERGQEIKRLKALVSELEHKLEELNREDKHDDI